MGISDTVMLALSLAVGGIVRHLLLGYDLLPLWSWALIPFWWCGALLTGLMPGWGLSAVDHLKRVVVLITVLFFIGMVGMFFLRSADSVSRLSITVAWGLSVVWIPLGRAGMRRLLCNRGVYGLPTIIFGRGVAAAEAAERLLYDRGTRLRPVGICTDDFWPQDNNSIPILGNLKETTPFAPAAVISLEGLEEATKKTLVDQVLAGYRTVMIMPDLGDIPSLLVSSRDVGGLVGLEISQTLLHPFATKIKRLVDLALIILSAPLWLPVCTLVCMLIWFEDGKSPVYKQERVGRGERPFLAYKCRTMVVNAEEVLKRHLAADPVMRLEWEKDFKLKNDPRITRLGKFLRRTSLDELPQLINVLYGDMALVGPRPLPSYHLEKMPLFIRAIRSQVRPGITGLWQVSGRSDIGNAGMTRWDPYYVKKLVNLVRYSPHYPHDSRGLCGLGRPLSELII